MPIKCELVERVSSKGNKYTALVVHLTENLEKLVFLSQAEVELLKLKNSK